MSDLIQYKDNVIIEIAAPTNRAIAVKASAVDKVEATFDSVMGALTPVIAPLAGLVKQASDALVEAEVKIGVGFTAEGSVFVTKASAEANLEITLKFKRGASK